jgi:hypothetical protein
VIASLEIFELKDNYLGLYESKYTKVKDESMIHKIILYRGGLNDNEIYDISEDSFVTDESSSDSKAEQSIKITKSF